MGEAEYSTAIGAELTRMGDAAGLEIRHRPTRYDAGQVLRVAVCGILPAVEGIAELEVEKFLGGGFAGQVYRCRVQKLELPPGRAIAGLTEGALCAIKIIVPPSNARRLFRNFMYWLAFQGPFSAQVNRAACRAGLLWQKLVRRAAGVVLGRETAVKDAYATFWDDTLNAYGEITEWVEGRVWLLETDGAVHRRRRWRTLELTATASAEYVAKRQFMAEMVDLMHAMGAPEFARQYEWWTMKSQPNVLKRIDVGETGPAGGLCAIDFRAGLALLPFLPMSPVDVKLIFAGLWQRRALVQFDRCDVRQLELFMERRGGEFASLMPLAAELKELDRAYRRSLPDLTHHGLRLLFDAELRRDVKAGLVEGYRAGDLVDEAFAKKLTEGRWGFRLFYILGAIPILGAFVRRRWGNAAYRRHARQLLTSPRYLLKALGARAAYSLVDWHRDGRTGESRSRFLARHPLIFTLESATLGWLPIPVLHRALTDPAFVLRRAKQSLWFAAAFWRSAEFRERWFLDMIAEGEKDGMLSAAEARTIAAHARDPFIGKYLKCLAVHFATLPVTQIVSVIVGGAAAAWLLAAGRSRGEAVACFFGILGLFQVLPISPGSICRGVFVLYLMIRERNLRDYLVAAPLSFVKYIGYLAFPLQMTTTYPQLAQFLAGRWATSMVRLVPVFGERGALLEHWVFDLCFNLPQMLAAWAKPRAGALLTAWLVFGVGLAAGLMHWLEVPPGSKAGINAILAAVCVFVLPRVLFFPLLAGAKGKRQSEAAASEAE